MRNSLHKNLNRYIQVNGTVSYNTIKDLVETGFWGRKFRMSTAERKLRPSNSPEVESVMNEHGVIVAYRWKGKPLEFKRYYVLDDKGQREREINLVVK